MKHLRIFEEISSSISQELLGIDGKYINKGMFLNLAEKFFKEKDSQSFNHLMGLIKYSHPEFFKDIDFARSFGELVSKYNIEGDDTFAIDGDKVLPGEFDALKKDSMRSKNYLKADDDVYSLRVRLDQEIHNLADKLTSMYNLPSEKFRAALLKGAYDAVNVLQSEVKSRR